MTQSGADGAADRAASALGTLVDGVTERLPYLAIGVVVVIVFNLLGRVVRRAAHTAGARTRIDVQLADVLGAVAYALLSLLGVLVAAVVVFPTFRPGDLIAGLGITSVAVGFAFKDILQNFFAGILILLRKPFVVGDQIRVKEHEGTVEEITTRSTRLRTYDGERVVIPNGDVYTSSIVVRTAYATRRVKVSVGVGYPDDIERARRTLLDAVTGCEGVHADPGPWAYVEELAPSSVNFTVYFWTDSTQATVLRVRDRAVTAIKRALDAAGIDMPYPHTVVVLDAPAKSADDRAADAAQVLPGGDRPG